MFQVVKKDKPDEVYCVFDAQKRECTAFDMTYFLFFKNGKWVWESSSDYIPAQSSTAQ